jgi:predicted aspartyl protease
MISGEVNAYREAVVRLPVRSPRGREQAIEAIVDTGFNGYLTLPPDVIAELGLPFREARSRIFERLREPWGAP